MKKYIKVNVIISILLGISILYLILKQFSKATGSICLIRGIVGIPCPSCGISRAILSFLNGDFAIAFKYHPLFWMPFVIILIIILNKKYYKEILIGAIIIFSIVYIVRIFFLFPSVEPMKYNEKAIFNKL